VEKNSAAKGFTLEQIKAAHAKVKSGADFHATFTKSKRLD
jgi:hypothetical protein